MKRTTLYSLILCLVGFLSTERVLAQDLFKCELGVTLSATGTCDGTTGAITLEITGGFGKSYTIDYSNQYTRTFSGEIVTKDNKYTITGLPPARHTIIVTDNHSKCEVTEQITVVSNYVQGKITVKGKPATCGGYGAVDVAIDGNEGPYDIDVTGPVTASYLSNTNNFSVYNLTSGDYEIVIGQGDCIQTFSATVDAEPNLPRLTLDPVTDDCGIHSGAVDFLIANGAAPYEVVVNGPTSATFNVSRSFPTDGLAEGSYQAVLTDANGCRSIAVMELTTTTLGASMETIGVGTRGSGFLKVTPKGGHGDYKITYNGPVSGYRMVDDRTTLIPALAGIYDVTITDANGDGCSITESVTVEAGESDSKIGGITTGNAISGDKVILHQNYPNPFNEQTTIRFELPQSMEATLTIQDHFGRVITKQQQVATRGRNEFVVNGDKLSTGMYFYTISTEGFSETKRMVVQ